MSFLKPLQLYLRGCKASTSLLRRSLPASSRQNFATSSELSIQMNEIFTDEERSMIKGDINEEISCLHRDFNDKFLQTIDSSINDASIQSYQHHSLTSHSQSLSSSSSQFYRGASSHISNLQRRMRTSQSTSEKLHIAGLYCKHLKLNFKVVDSIQRESIKAYLAHILEGMIEDPSNYENTELIQLLNVSRGDYLNLPLPPHLSTAIKKAIADSYQILDYETVKNIFYASSNRHRDLAHTFIDVHVVRFWFKQILTRLKSGLNTERDLILILSCYQKDTDLYRKTHKSLAQMVQKSILVDGILKNSDNGELLKVLVNTFTRNETCPLQLLALFVDSAVMLISKGCMTIPQFQVIFRQLLRSQTFVSQRILVCYDVKAQEAGAAAAAAATTTPIVTKNQNFEVIDRFVHEHLNEFSENQLFNILNLYQTLNATLHKKTVEKLLARLLEIEITEQCDNFFAFNIIVRIVTLYRFENPKKYMAWFKNWDKRTNDISFFQKQVANTLAIVKHCLGEEYYTEQYENVHLQLLKVIADEEDKRKQSQRTSSSTDSRAHLTAATLSKRVHFNEISKLFEELQIECKQAFFIDSIHVDFYIVAGDNQKESEEKLASGEKQQQLSLPPYSFALDIITANDYVIQNEAFHGSLQLKYEVLRKMHVPCVLLSEEFCIDLLSIQDHKVQKEVLIKHINKQIQAISLL